MSRRQLRRMRDPPPIVLKVPVKYGLLTCEALVAAGKYDEVDVDLSEISLGVLSGVTDVRIELHSFGMQTQRIQVESYFCELGLRHAFPVEVLMIGAVPVHRDLQRQFPITTLDVGGVYRRRFARLDERWEWGRAVVVLTQRRGGRVLTYANYEGSFVGRGWRFAAV